MTIEDLKSRLTGVKERSPGKWTARCPCTKNHKNGDQSPSFEFGYDSSTQKILVHCHTGCTVPEICEALGITMADLMPQEKDKLQDFVSWIAKQNGMTFEALYSYCYGAYNDGLAKVRFRKPDGGKDFKWIKADTSKKSGYALTHKGCPNRLYVRGDLNSETVFIVEGEKDVDNLYALTHYTAACTENGALKITEEKASAGKKWLDEYTEQLQGKTVYILWDNDQAGRDFASIEAGALNGHAANVFMLDLLKVWPECPEKGDISDMIKALGNEEAGKRLSSLMDMAEPWKPAEEPQEIAPATTAEAVDAFLSKAQTRIYEPIKTGYSSIDTILGGGLIRQTLILLGAAPGAGKTIFAQQVCETIAKNNAGNVLYFNLEMPVEQLFSRALSRKTELTSLQILQGYKWLKPIEEDIRRAAEEYKREIAPRIKYNPCDSVEYEQILECMEAEAKALEEKGDTLPLVIVVDYLQLLKSRQEKDTVEVIKNATLAFKRFAIERKCVVILIMAQSRSTNENGIATQGAGRDTSSLEYTADVQIALTYKAMLSKKANSKGNLVAEYDSLSSLFAKAGELRDKGLTKEADALIKWRRMTITKNRFGVENAFCDLYFEGEYSKFIEKAPKSLEEPPTWKKVKLTM